MDNIFSGSELVELSIQVERNGLEFYAALAQKSRDPGIADLFVFLAREEEKHITVFKKMCAKIEGCGAPEVIADEYIAYMHALAGEHVFTRQGEGAKAAQAILGDAQALDVAIGFEKDSIIFYEGMRRLVPQADMVVVDALIAQEKSHLMKLVRMKNDKAR